MNAVAVTTLSCTHSDGTAHPVQIGVGQPSPHPDGGWTCPVSALGLKLWEGSRDIAGVDSWQALILALTFLRRMLAEEVRLGAVLHWPDDVSEVGLDEVFGHSG